LKFETYNIIIHYIYHEQSLFPSNILFQLLETATSAWHEEYLSRNWLRPLPTLRVRDASSSREWFINEVTVIGTGGSSWTVPTIMKETPTVAGAFTLGRSAIIEDTLRFLGAFTSREWFINEVTVIGTGGSSWTVATIMKETPTVARALTLGRSAIIEETLIVLAAVTSREWFINEVTITGTGAPTWTVPAIVKETLTATDALTLGRLAIIGETLTATDALTLGRLAIIGETLTATDALTLGRLAIIGETLIVLGAFTLRESTIIEVTLIVIDASCWTEPTIGKVPTPSDASFLRESAIIEGILDCPWTFPGAVCSRDSFEKTSGSNLDLSFDHCNSSVSRSHANG
jgi:hypothetical protein